MALHKKYGSERVHRAASLQSVSLMSAIRAHPFGERTPIDALQKERCARKAAWDLAKNVYKLNNTDKATFYFPVEVRAMPTPTSKLPEELEFVADSRASMHMLSKKVIWA